VPITSLTIFFIKLCLPKLPSNIMKLMIRFFFLTTAFFLLNANPVAAGETVFQDTVTVEPTPEPPFDMRLNRGIPVTRDRDLVIELRPTKTSFKLIEYMRVGFKPNLSDAKWTPIESIINLSILGGDGKKFVYARLKDKAGNSSEIISKIITFDTKAPTNIGITINDQARITNSKTGKVKLRLQADDVFKMQINNSPDFENAKWEKFTSERLWILGPAGDGEKTVYARFADRIDNISEMASASILLDTQPPEGTLQINDGALYTTKHDISLKITSDAQDLASIRIVANEESKTIEINSSINSTRPRVEKWVLDTLEGKKFVAVYFRDQAGNISPQPYVADIILDTNPPEVPYLLINNGSKFTIDQSGMVNLKIKTRETPIGITMLVSNNADLSESQELRFQGEIKEWQLEASQDGQKTIYIQFVDAAGNKSEISKSKITLDRSIPVATSLQINDGSEWSQKPVVNLYLSAEGADFMQVSNNADFTGARWRTYAAEIKEWILVGDEGENTVYIRFRDRAGNISQTMSSGVKLAATPPAGRVVINKGDKVTNQEEVTLNFFHNSYALEMMVSNDSTFKGGSWRKVEEELERFKLPGADGEKVVYAKFRDASGQVSTVASDQIQIDRQPPQNPRIVINRNAKFVVNREKKIRILISVQGASFMRFSQNADFEQVEWEQFQRAKDLVLDGEDGPKTIYAQFQDENGNVSETVTDEIILDREPPTPRLFVINDGAEWTNDPDKRVTIKINADDAVSMKVSSDPKFTDLEWQPFKKLLSNYQLDGEDGEKYLYIVFKDEASNVSKALSAKINLKRSF